MYHKIVIICLFSAVFCVAGGQGCGKCDRSTCEEVGVCINGKTLDVCGCCDVCARRLGQRCDAPDTIDKKNGKCGEFLICKKSNYRGDTSEEYVCVCEDDTPVCGTDSITYSTLCKLLENMADNSSVNVFDRAPCKQGPTIQSMSKGTSRPKGSILVMDCEAIGYPVPTVSWQLYKKDGSSIDLPSDDSTIAVQMRGGPEKNMATGWVQIVDLTEHNVGIYTCIAKNSQGETKQSVEVSLSEIKV